MEGIDNSRIDLEIPGAKFYYYENFLCEELADFYFETFELMPFQQGEVRNGRENRLNCFCSEVTENGKLKEYYYSGKINKPLEFSDELRELKNSIEMSTGYKFNCCLVNLYQHGKHTIGMHSDSMSSLVPNSAIASVSLGTTRTFDIVAKNNAPNPNYSTSIKLPHGSLIIMADDSQLYYKHGIRQEASIKKPRINLTFRLAK